MAASDNTLEMKIKLLFLIHICSPLVLTQQSLLCKQCGSTLMERVEDRVIGACEEAQDVSSFLTSNSIPFTCFYSAHSIGLDVRYDDGIQLLFSSSSVYVSQNSRSTSIAKCGRCGTLIGLFHHPVLDLNPTCPNSFHHPIQISNSQIEDNRNLKSTVFWKDQKNIMIIKNFLRAQEEVDKSFGYDEKKQQGKKPFCLEKQNGFWKYLFCYKSNIWQYHSKDSQIDLGQFNPIETNGKDAIIQRYNSEKDIVGRDRSRRRALVQIYSNGKMCETEELKIRTEGKRTEGFERRTEVLFYCCDSFYPHTYFEDSHHIQTVREIELCVYEIGICVESLCKIPGFSTSQGLLKNTELNLMTNKKSPSQRLSDLEEFNFGIEIDSDEDFNESQSGVCLLKSKSNEFWSILDDKFVIVQKNEDKCRNSDSYSLSQEEQFLRQIRVVPP